MRGVAVLGTSPGIGTTRVAAGLASALAARDLTINVAKLVETGCTATLDPNTDVQIDGIPGGPLDAEARQAYARLTDLAGPPSISVSTKTPNASLQPRGAAHLLDLLGDLPRIRDLNLITPYRYSPNVSPAMAALLAERPIDPDHLHATLEHLTTTADAVVLDAGGAALDPLTLDLTILDIIARADFPVLLVGPSRQGTTSELRLLLEVLQARHLRLAGIVLNRLQRRARPEEAATPFLLEQISADIVLGVLPYVDPLKRKSSVHLVKRFNIHVDVNRIIAAMDASP